MINDDYSVEDDNNNDDDDDEYSLDVNDDDNSDDACGSDDGDDNDSWVMMKIMMIMMIMFWSTHRLTERPVIFWGILKAICGFEIGKICAASQNLGRIVLYTLFINAILDHTALY